MANKRLLPIEKYQVGVICALPDEMSAAIAILDERHQPIVGQDKLDDNNYVLGRVHEHNVAIACLPAGVYGTNSAVRVARDMLRTFTGLRFGLMVGIGGGIPNLEKGLDIRLGDVVISQPDKIYGGVVQYDLGKNLGDEQFERQGVLKPPPTMLLTALATLRADQNLDGSQIPRILADIIKQYPKLVENGYGFPGRDYDNLHCPRCDSSSSASCNLCADGIIKRVTRKDENPAFWYGVIASGKELMKNAAARDRIGREFGALCVEMEAAGLMNDFPCIVIRGICDYADYHKNDAWQRYAALTAAAYAKELLGYISPEQTSLEKPIYEIVDILSHQLEINKELLKREKQRVVKEELRYQNDKHRLCHQTLKTSRYEQHKDINPPRVSGTCQWVLNHKKYRTWHENPRDDLLWISADPGCGKSVLAKSLVDNELQISDTHTVCYFFFKDNDEQDHLVTALCALLHQLFSYQPSLIRYAIPAWKKNAGELKKEASELWRIFMEAATAPESHNITCVLDALDECRLVDRRWLIGNLAQFYIQISRSSSTTRRGRLKFLITSRPYDDILFGFQKTLDNLPTIRIRGDEENDQIHREVDLVIRLQVAKLAKDSRLNAQTMDQLEDKLLKMEHRTYLWLHLVIEGIYETYRNSLRPDEASIKSIPSTVEVAYENILGRVTQEQTGDVKKILQIVVGARRPLTIQEMAIALGIATSAQPKSLNRVTLDPVSLEMNIRHWCGLFLFINHARIYLIHQTAREFLICHSGSAVSLSGWKHCLDPQKIEKQMTQICVEFLCFEDSRSKMQCQVQKFQRYRSIDGILDKDNSVESLLAYSAEHWPYHLRNADMATNESSMANISQLYDTDSSLYGAWFAIFWKASNPYEEQPQMNSIRLAALLGHGKILKLLLQSNKYYEIDGSDSASRTALIWASREGYENVVQILVERGADVNAQGGENGNALCTASARGHEMIVQILIDGGADVNAQGGKYGNALYAASELAYEKIVQILVERGADVNAQGGTYGNALCAASDRGHEKTVQILVERGADVNAQGKYGNALYAASVRGHEKIVKILVDGGADVNTQDGLYGNALYAASVGGNEKIVQILIDRGADVNVHGFYDNALYAASEGGHEKIVQILVDGGADVNAHGSYGNALYVASKRGHEKIVQILVDGGADVNDQGVYDNALYAASVRGHEKVVQILVERGAAINAQGRRHSNALYAASIRGHEKIVQILVDGGADVDAQGGEYGNALYAASALGREKIVQVLIDGGAEVNAQGGKYGNALCAASEGGHEKVVQILVDGGADVNTQGGFYDNALYAASVRGHKKVVQILIERGAAINAQGKGHSNALYAASERGREKVVQILIDRGADVNARGEYGNALCAASVRGHKEIVQILVDGGADVNAQGGTHGNALCAASELGHKEIVQILVDGGADVNAQGGEYGNALYAASELGHEKIVQVLVDGGADVDAQGGTHGNALCAASEGGYEKIVKILVDGGADVNAHGRYDNALCAASEDGHEKIVQILVDGGADVNAQGEYGNALYAASEGGHEKIVQILVDRGADVNAHGKYGNALYAASEGGHEKIVQILVDGGADVDAQGGTYGNALCAASEGGHEKVVQILLDRGADVNAHGSYGNALYVASELGHEKIVRILVDRGADVNAQGEYGNALYVASEGGHEKIVQILVDGGANANAQEEFYGKALYIASARGHEEIVQILLNKVS